MREKNMTLQELIKKREELQTLGNILEEVEILIKIANLSKETYGQESDEYIKALNELGGSLKYVGRYDEAKKYLEIARETISKKYGTDNLAYANNLLNLIEVKRYAGETDGLEDIYNKISLIYIKNKADRSFDYAALCNNFGLFYQNLKEYKKAYEKHKISLEILTKNMKKEYMLEYAVTLCNLFVPCVNLSYEKLALDYLYQALDIFEKELSTEHPLYAASLNNLGVHFFGNKEYEKALEYFEKSLEICRKTMGEASENYKNLFSNVEYLREIVTSSRNSHPKIYKKLNGLELSELYFKDVVLPAFEQHLSDIIPLCAFGLVGPGSECFGYDDEISKDHDFGPSVCIFMREEDKVKYEERIVGVLKTLPKEYLGFSALRESQYAGKRRGLISIEDFYFNLIGKSSCPSTILEWKNAPETGLSAASNGKVFKDELGVFSKIREDILAHYPKAIKENRIATRLVNMSQYGQYNYTRCLRRNDLVTANICLNKFIYELMHLIFLLNNRYMIFYKWSFKALSELPILGKEIQEILNEMIFNRNKVPDVRRICNMVIKEIKRQKLSNLDSDYLEDFGVDIQKKYRRRLFQKLQSMVRLR